MGRAGEWGVMGQAPANTGLPLLSACLRDVRSLGDRKGKDNVYDAK